MSISAAASMAASAASRLQTHHFLCLLPKPMCNKASILALPTCLSIPNGALSLRKAAPLPPLVARTSDWAQQEEENETREVVPEDESEDLVAEGEEFGGGEELEGGDVVSEGSESEEEYREPPEEAKLFVGNLPLDMDSEILAQLFDQAGIVEVAEVIYNRGTDQSRGFGFVTMSTVEEAEKAIETFNRYDCNGRILTVNKAAPRGTRAERPRREFGPSYNIYVGNLPWSVDESRLRQVFSEHGNVVNARVILDRDTGRSRGFGFVSMSSQTEQEDAVAALDGQSMDGRTLRVNIAAERPRPGY